MRAAADGIIAWKKADNGSEPGGDLINNAFLELAGTTPGDWFPIGMSRLGVTDDYDGYLAVLRQKVEKRYVTKDKLSRAKATEWHRISLAVLAAGGDPTSFGKNADGSAIDLIADGTYDRGRTAPLGRQGINGWIWGLIALDSMRYPVPDGAFYTRDDLITAILSQQLCDGGFALTGSAADPDITAMAVQALAPGAAGATAELVGALGHINVRYIGHRHRSPCAFDLLDTLFAHSTPPKQPGNNSAYLTTAKSPAGGLSVYR